MPQWPPFYFIKKRMSLLGFKEICVMISFFTWLAIR